MAQLDLEEQEKLDQIKAFWKRYGNFILLLLIIAMASYVAWNRWENHQHGQALQASAMYDELDKAVAARDAAKAAQVFADLKERYPKTMFTQQGAFLLAKFQFESKDLDASQTSLAWVDEHATTEEYKALARLRLAGVLLEAKKLDEALKYLGPSPSPAFEALTADRRGDVLLAMNKQPEAVAAYTEAWKAMTAQADYRRVVAGKLGALGVSVSDASAGVSP